MNNNVAPEYGWKNNDATCAHTYLFSGVEKALANWRLSNAIAADTQLRLFDAGCGNGYIASVLAGKKYEIAGCDFSREGVAQARNLLPDSKFEIMSVYENMADVFGGGGGMLFFRQRLLNIYMIPENLCRIFIPYCALVACLSLPHRITAI